MNDETLHLAATLGQLLKAAGATVTVAESCTGGGVGAAITAVPGSSAWFEVGFITYSNTAKQRWLRVDPALLDRVGAVSGEVVDAMAAGAVEQSGADYAVAVSGVAGPDGGSADKPVGTIWFAWAGPGGRSTNECCRFAGDRASVRRQAVIRALQGLVKQVQQDLERGV